MVLSIRKKIYASFLSIIILFLITVVVSTSLTSRIVRLTRDIIGSEKRLEVVQRINLFARTVNDNGAHYLLASVNIESDFNSRFEANVAYLKDEILLLSEITPNPEGRLQIDEFKNKWEAYVKIKRSIMSLKQLGETSKAHEQYSRDSFDSIAFALHAFSKAEQRQIDQYKTEIESNGQTIRFVNFVTLVSGFLLSLIVAFGMSNNLVRRIGLLKSSAQTVAQGNLEVPALQLRGKDELTDLAHAFNTMTESLRSVIDSNQLLQQLSERDALTGIANRRSYDQMLERLWNGLALQRKTISLIICDIDYFKRFNDYYGHQAGDICLKNVAGTIQDTLDIPGALAARYGGEEFVILLPETDKDEALRAAKRIQYAITELRIPHIGSEVCSYVSLSMGVSTLIASDSDQPGTLLIQADKALYQAKEMGRNRISIYNA